MNDEIKRVILVVATSMVWLWTGIYIGAHL
jgi:hypothetical protein